MLKGQLIVSRYQNNYGGAVKRLNAISEHLATLDFTKAPVFAINGLKREELIAANSMILHELYFDGLGARTASSLMLSNAISAAWNVGPLSSAFWARRKAAGLAGCCSCTRSVAGN